MVARLYEVDPVVLNEVHDSVLLSQPARPEIWPKMLEPLGLADADERIAEDCLDDLQETEGCPSIGLHPVAEILAKLGLEYGFAAC